MTNLSDKLESSFDAQVVTDLVEIFKQMIKRIIRNLSQVSVSVNLFWKLLSYPYRAVV